MFNRLERDHARFRQIVRGKIKQELRKYLSSGELIGRQGKDLVSIPLPQIEIPHFCYGEQQTGGVGQGEGEPGTVLGPGQGGRGPGAGDQPGGHILEVEVSIEELALLLGEELELPRIQPKGEKNIVSQKNRYTGISQTGPESLRHFRRTYKKALRRQLIAGQYDPRRPQVIPIRRDQQYRSWKTIPLPESRAAILYMMDVSGSMGEEQKQLVRAASFWIDSWLRAQYQGIECRYLAHDAEAREVDQETFYRIREGGGTRISSAYHLCLELIKTHYDPAEWNLYCFHFSDGDNLSADNPRCLELLEQELLGKVNLFGYGQVRSAYGSGEFLGQVQGLAAGREELVIAELRGREDLLEAIRAFLGKGR
jgi:sporulation protein YhbH